MKGSAVHPFIDEQARQRIYFFLFRAAAFLSLIILLLVLAYLLIKGSSVMSWHFLTNIWSHQNIAKGGIIQAIIGTVFLCIGVVVVTLPIGMATAIYLNEYAKDTLFRRIIALSVRNLAGVPSVIYGVFGLAFFVLSLHLGTSLLAAILTLSCMTLPWIITASEEALKTVPAGFREGSLALGATQWQTIHKNVLPHASGGMLTGGILGMSRAMGETAPIIIVGATFYMGYISFSPLDKFMALPYHAFILATQHADASAMQYALGTALVLILLTSLLNIGAFLIRHRLRKKKEW
ncbi:MAG: phosphate ABC transporter permease PstA [archaeon]